MRRDAYVECSQDPGDPTEARPRQPPPSGCPPRSDPRSRALRRSASTRAAPRTVRAPRQDSAQVAIKESSARRRGESGAAAGADHAWLEHPGIVPNTRPGGGPTERRSTS